MPKTDRVAPIAHPCRVLLAGLVLSGCSQDYGTRQFGITRDPQEQTRVATPAPLSLPPILSERMTDQATSASQAGPGTPSGPTRSAAPSAGEESLLDAAGPSAPGDIRTRVNQDAQLGQVDPTTANTILYGQPAQQPIVQRDKSWLGRLF
ncbi:MAG: hypothetical protein J2P47_05110 [Acetobacteraceae bacterium]|nr:hypothetical protein [Acetobacteraceae bacterium]